MHQSRRIRILFLYSAQSYGGLIRNLSLIASHLDTSRFEATFLALAAPGDSGYLLRAEKREGIRLETLVDTARIDRSSLAVLRARLDADEFDLLSAHGHKADCYVAFLRLGGMLRARLRRRIPCIAIAHGWVVPGVKMKLYDWIDKLSLFAFDKVVLVDAKQRREVPLLSAAKTVVIPNAIPEFSRPSSAERHAQRELFSLSEADFAIGFCGRLSPEKGIATALHAVAKLVARSERSERIRFFICGEGVARGALESLAVELGIEANVIFLGFIDEVYQLLIALDVYLSCSTREGLPNNVLEAQSVGIPCVLSEIPPHQALANNGAAAVLVPTTEAQEYANALGKLLADSTLREEIGAAGYAHVRHAFSMQRRIEALQKEYLELVQG